MLEIIDKLSNTINKYKLDFNNINISILSKSEKVIYYVISIKYDDNIKSKKFKKYIVPYNRKTKINENSLNNLKYMKKSNILQLDDKISGNIENDFNNELIKYNKEDYIYKENDDKIIDKIQILNIEKLDNIGYDYKQNINSELIKKDKNNENLEIESCLNNEEEIEKVDENNKFISEIDNNEFINADILINEEIDNYGCDNCKMMDNNVDYLFIKTKNLYLDILKNYDNILDGTYYVNNNLEEAINIQNVKNKNIKIDLYSILQNKRKLNIDDINRMKNILEEDYEFPHITQLFRNKIVDPIIEELRFIKNEFNNFIELTT